MSPLGSRSASSAAADVLESPGELLGAILSFVVPGLACRLVSRSWEQEKTPLVVDVAMARGSRADEVPRAFPNLTVLRCCDPCEWGLICMCLCVVMCACGVAGCPTNALMVMSITRLSSNCYHKLS